MKRVRTILHVCEHFGGSGSSLHGPAKAFQLWLPRFDTVRYNIMLCSRKHRDAAAVQMEAAGIKPLYLGYAKFNPMNLRALLLLIKQHGVDILHCHGYGACLWGRLAGFLCRIPVIVHGRGNYGTVPWYMRPVERVLGPVTRYALAVSESTRLFMIRKRYIPENVVEVLYNGIDIESYGMPNPKEARDARKMLGIGTREIVIGMVGRLEPYKGHLDVFTCLKQLKGRFPSILCLVAGDGPYMAALQQWVKENSMEKHIVFLGFRNDIKRLIAAFDVHVLPGHREGLPNTMLESMASGRVIVASDVDGQAEILSDGKDALLYPAGNTALLRECLEAVLTDPALRTRLSRNALQRVRDFDIRKTISSIEHVYEKAFAESSRGMLHAGQPLRLPPRRRPRRRTVVAVGFSLLALTGILGAVEFAHILHHKEPVGEYAWRHAPYEFSIGVMNLSAPFEEPSYTNNSLKQVLTKESVTSVPASFVADPFLFRRDGVWYIFFEVLNKLTSQGDIAVAESRDGETWKYKAVVLDEPFHLSFPYVFMDGSDIYMLPETRHANEIRLYKAMDFPLKWVFDTTLIKGAYVDPNIIRHKGYWWLFAGGPGNDSLHVFYSEKLKGPWREHPLSPVVKDDPSKARPAGRLIVYEGALYRCAQNCTPRYGTSVRVFRITDLSPDTYGEEEISGSPILGPGALAWNSLGMHTFDMHMDPDGGWLACVDGFSRAKPDIILNCRFDNGVNIKGISVWPRSVKRGGTCMMRFFIHGAEKIETGSEAVFVHCKKDGAIFQGDFDLVKGKEIYERLIHVPDTVPEGEYDIFVGQYMPSTGRIHELTGRKGKTRTAVHLPVKLTVR